MQTNVPSNVKTVSSLDRNSFYSTPQVSNDVSTFFLILSFIIKFYGSTSAFYFPICYHLQEVKFLVLLRLSYEFTICFHVESNFLSDQLQRRVSPIGDRTALFFCRGFTTRYTCLPTTEMANMKIKQLTFRCVNINEHLTK